MDRCGGLYEAQAIDMEPQQNQLRNRRKSNIEMQQLFEPKVEIMELREEHRKQCKALLVEMFIKNKFDPLYHNLKNKQVFRTFVDYYLSKSISSNTTIRSFVAVDTANEDVVVGVLICDDYEGAMEEEPKQDLRTRSHSVSDQYDHIFQFLTEIKTKYVVADIVSSANTVNQHIDGDEAEDGVESGDSAMDSQPGADGADAISIPQRKALEFRFSAVRIDYQRMGIMTNLKQFAMVKARENGYTECVSIALNRSTVALNEKLGFDVMWLMAYEYWRYRDGYPLKVPAQETQQEQAVLMRVML